MRNRLNRIENKLFHIAAARFPVLRRLAAVMHKIAVANWVLMQAQRVIKKIKSA